MRRRLTRSSLVLYSVLFCFFFNDTSTTEIYTLSLYDALPSWATVDHTHDQPPTVACQRTVPACQRTYRPPPDRYRMSRGVPAGVLQHVHKCPLQLRRVGPHQRQRAVG